MSKNVNRWVFVAAFDAHEKQSWQQKFRGGWRRGDHAVHARLPKAVNRLPFLMEPCVSEKPA